MGSRHGYPAVPLPASSVNHRLNADKTNTTSADNTQRQKRTRKPS